MKMSDLKGRVYVVEGEHPVPRLRSAPDKELYVIAKQMKVGESMEIPKYRSNMSARLSISTGYKFTQKTISETAMRVWRVA